MPELPEVETIRRALAAELIGRRIASVRVRRRDIIGHPGTTAAFHSLVVGRTVKELGRRGKYLIIRLDRNAELVFHLRLSGHLEIVLAGQTPKYERVRFELDDGRALSFAEPRVLGRVYAVIAAEYPKVLKGMIAMGPEPISGEFTSRFLEEKLRGRKAAVKSLLLDQRVCCGIGNIYSDEALFRAGVRPGRRAGALRPAEVRRLAKSLGSVLKDGIKWCGTTMADARYLLPDGQTGKFQERLAVFGREGEACRKCGSQIRRTRIGNRSTHFCPTCQS